MLKNKRRLAFVALLFIVAALFWGLARPAVKPLQPRSLEPQPGQAQLTPVLVDQANSGVPDVYPQQSLRNQSREAAIKTHIENIRRDPQYQWKVPIRFYGKVVDQNGYPVVDAIVYLQWVNLGGKRGVGEAQIKTNSNGSFSFEGVKGKRLIVLQIENRGYFEMNLSENQTGFEFANPAEDIFYEPDSNNPVTFVMRKKGETQPLVVESIELNMRGQGSTQTVDLLTGKVAQTGGQLQVTVWKPTITAEQIRTAKVFPYDWRIQVKLDDGGLAEHKDIFAFEAPESGYLPDFDVKLRPTNGASADVTVNKQFYFYFGEPRRYGRLQLRTDGDRPYVFVDYWFNPAPGSRNLEFDPAKVVKSP